MVVELEEKPAVEDRLAEIVQEVGNMNGLSKGRNSNRVYKDLFCKIEIIQLHIITVETINRPRHFAGGFFFQRYIVLSTRLSFALARVHLHFDIFAPKLKMSSLQK